jgi:hypothetical protein
MPKRSLNAVCWRFVGDKVREGSIRATIERADGKDNWGCTGVISAISQGRVICCTNITICRVRIVIAITR